MQSKSMDTFLYDRDLLLRGAFRYQSNIYDRAFGEKNLQLLFQNENFYVTTILQLSKRCWPLVAINPFSTNVPLLYPLKSSENLRFSDIFRAYKSGTLVENGLIKSISKSCSQVFHRTAAFINFTKFLSPKVSTPNIFQRILRKSSEHSRPAVCQSAISEFFILSSLEQTSLRNYSFC